MLPAKRIPLWDAVSTACLPLKKELMAPDDGGTENTVTHCWEKTALSCSELARKTPGITKVSSDMSSTKLFCTGVPVSKMRRLPCQNESRKAGGKRNTHRASHPSTITTNLEAHKVGVALGLHVFQHVALVKNDAGKLDLSQKLPVHGCADGGIVPAMGKH